MAAIFAVILPAFVPFFAVLVNKSGTLSRVCSLFWCFGKQKQEVVVRLYKKQSELC